MPLKVAIREIGDVKILDVQGSCDSPEETKKLQAAIWGSVFETLPNKRFKPLTTKLLVNFGGKFSASVDVWGTILTIVGLKTLGPYEVKVLSPHQKDASVIRGINTVAKLESFTNEALALASFR